jgi:hypothetical protein
LTILRTCAALPLRAFVAAPFCALTAAEAPLPICAMLALVDATAVEMPLVAPDCWALRDFVVWPWTCVSEDWPLETPFLTADVAEVLTALMADIAPGRVCLIAWEASRPLAWKVEPIFEPWLLTPETTWAPCSLTLPAVSPETLEATFALPSAAASLTPPPPPDCP